MLPFIRHLPGYWGNLYRRATTMVATLDEKYIKTAKRTYDPNHVRGIVDSLLKMKSERRDNKLDWFTDEHISNIVYDIIIAGVLTSYASITGLFLIILNHAHVQKQIQDEIDKVIGQGRKPRVADCKNMPYTHACILEAMRYISVIPVPLARLASRDVNLDGYLIDKGSMVVISKLTTIKYKKPWTFDPERYLDDDGHLILSEDPRRQSSTSFGLGRRQCPGESFATKRIFLFITTFLQQFKLLPAKEHDLPSCDSRGFRQQFTLSPDPYYCRTESRT
ncbi:hypothetical protein ScPMuIL_015324 [Solemya velum]